jgi:hypothetical protein
VKLQPVFSFAFGIVLAALTPPSGVVAQSAAQSGATAAAAASPEPPYARLARDLATPDLAFSAGPKDKSLLDLRFVGAGQSDRAWTKMTSISIAKVDAAQTQAATRAVITRFKQKLAAQKHAKILTFDYAAAAAPHAFFAFYAADGTAAQGIAYSPAQGFVSVIQVSYRHGFAHRAQDRDVLEAAIAAR